MQIDDLDEDLVAFINLHLPKLDWQGGDTSAYAYLELDEYNTIEDELMDSIAGAIVATRTEEFSLTIRPSENQLILYYID